jgi:hypothetical protein
MKVLTGAVLALLFALVRPPIANVAEIEPFGMFSAMIGAERETGEPNGHDVGRGGPRVTFGGLGVLPFYLQNFGLQSSVHYVGGQGSRFNASAGPVYGWAGGKSGIFLDYQHRALRSSDFFWIQPALALYFDQMNVNLSYHQPISGRQTRFRDGPDYDIVEVATSRAQGTVSYFLPMDTFIARKDNIEITFGLQINSFAGHDANKIRSVGVGPVIGASVMPWQNLEVNLFRVTADNRSRYQVNSGVQYFFTAANNQSLKEMRRKYLEAGPGPVAGYTAPRVPNS